MRIPGFLKADMERAFLQAYYRYVCGCESVEVDSEFAGTPWVATGIKPGRVWMMDFSTLYEFPLERKQANTNRRMKERAQQAVADGRCLWRLWHDLPLAAEPEVEYEVWCFMPPTDRVMQALAAAHHAGCQVTLVMPEQVQERVRQTVLAVPDDAEDQAFMQAAVMFRRAFGGCNS